MPHGCAYDLWCWLQVAIKSYNDDAKQKLCPQEGHSKSSSGKSGDEVEYVKAVSCILPS